ncbi:MAG: proton-conducting transporter membrane subunit [bacterium]|nr:proton-conducting transporter membrane subunit [bacterium]
MYKGMIVLSIFVPTIAGIGVFGLKSMEKAAIRNVVVTIVLVLNGCFSILMLNAPFDACILFYLTKEIPALFQVDRLSKLFGAITAALWICCGIFSFEYTKHEIDRRRYYGYLLITLGMVNGVCFAGNLPTLYMTFEMMSVVSTPLVLHSLEEDAVKAGMKYLFYSIGGASLALFGIVYLSTVVTSNQFMAGGTLDMAAVGGHTNLFLAMIFLCILGFGVKAGMFPFHGWLPTAHPVAPAPASALLSGVIAKAGVIAIMRVIFYTTGAEIIRGTWVQMTWIILAVISIFMGSMQAYREPLFKKRLAYSTVSQISYILVGLAVLNQAGFLGALLHTVFHAVIKGTSFLCAGAIMYKTNIVRVDGLNGIGKKMPVIMWSFIFSSLAIIGIPPTSGFVSKWFLAEGALASDLSFWSGFIPIILLVSALLTAGYMLPIIIHAFFPGPDYDYKGSTSLETSGLLVVPILVLGITTVVLGMFPGPLIRFISEIGQLVQ